MRNRKCNNLSSKYILPMFPYPSGSLHMGHMRVYTISDLTARYFRLNGFNVIHPIGWDAFGLPAENAARSKGIDPQQWTFFRELYLSALLHIYTLYSFYGSLTKCKIKVYWDPVDNTVLAAEQVDQEGRSWRSGAVAEKRKLRQWMVETPRYAKRLSDGLRKLTGWEEVAEIQSNWIGKCDVYRFLFPIKDDQHKPMEEMLDLRVADPLCVPRASFIIIRDGHPLSDRTRSSVESPYRLGIEVFNGISKVWMPVIVVPRNYDESIMNLDARCGDAVADFALMNQFQIVHDEQSLAPSNLCDIQEIAAYLFKFQVGNYGGYMTSRTLQDWVVSRQRSWGTPIPMILSADGKLAVPLSDDQLPLLQGRNPGEKVSCTQLESGEGYYDTDTLDTFFDSSWYYLRYLDPENEEALLSPEAATKMPVDIYIGGIEHAAVHMFFARFMSYFLADIGVIKEHEPFRSLIPQGIVRGKTYIDSKGRYFSKSEIVVRNNKYFSTDGAELKEVFEKMSKSKQNGVDPLDVLGENGVDLTRLQLIDSAAPRQPINWEHSDHKGLKKWIDRVAWIVSAYVSERKNNATNISEIPLNEKVEKELQENYNFFVRNVSMCIEVTNLHNTALARLQGFTNFLRKLEPRVIGSSPSAEQCIYALVTMMQIFIPFTAAELWAALQSVHPVRKSAPRSLFLDEISWPQLDPDCDIDFKLVVNGMGCGRVVVPRKEVEHLTLEELMERAKIREHRDVFEKMENNGFIIKSVLLNKRSGFHVTIDVTLEGNISPREILGMISDLQTKWRAASKKKKLKQTCEAA
ncbi:putative leucine--tRNA ligase [Dictyocaulus viviparus]|uniref:leucine--tRNA ligase n=1 Tax=Dictyocaulus viviparus TaxID=29172 RepID=A0A0D8YBW4_DICVI|nr:putative leucine--tRNA ligase [Dictyocaulus viviparus]